MGCLSAAARLHWSAAPGVHERCMGVVAAPSSCLLRVLVHTVRAVGTGQAFQSLQAALLLAAPVVALVVAAPVAVLVAPVVASVAVFVALVVAPVAVFVAAVAAPV